MSSETAALYVGSWRRLTNLSADRKGSIHDDDAAKSLGFKSAFVPGSTVATAAMPALVHCLGSRWMEGGWYRFTFVSPVYTDEDVREVAEEGTDGVASRVQTRDERLCCSGMAGFGFRPPWRPEDDGRGAGDVLPGVEIGLTFEQEGFVTHEPDIQPLLASAGDETPWYADSSPWGRGVVPPERLHGFALQITRSRTLPVSGVRNPGMWAQHDLVLRQPLFLDKTYVMTERVADKGRSGRTAFLTYEFEVLDASGTQLAIGRHKVKWLVA